MKRFARRCKKQSTPARKTRRPLFRKDLVLEIRRSCWLSRRGQTPPGPLLSPLTAACPTAGLLGLRIRWHVRSDQCRAGTFKRRRRRSWRRTAAMMQENQIPARRQAGPGNANGSLRHEGARPRLSDYDLDQTTIKNNADAFDKDC